MSKDNTTQRYVLPEVAEQLRAALANDALFLTPNTRLSAYLRQIIESIYLDSGQAVWQPARVVPIDAWVSSLWDTRLLAGDVEPKLLISATQDQLYWEQVIAQSSHASRLITTTAVAVQAQRAYQLLRQWLVDIDEHRFAFSSTADSQAFFEWVQAYQALLADTDHICQVDAQYQMLEGFDDTRQYANSIVMVGFQSPTPLQQRLIGKLSGDKTIVELDLSVDCRAVTTVACESVEAELQAAAKWAKQALAQDPDTRIAVVVQNLAQMRLQVERIFLALFDPNALAVGGEDSGSAVNISAGTALSKTATVSVALTLIDSTLGPLPLGVWSDLLVSPYFGDDSVELPYRLALLDCAHEAGEWQYQITELTRLAVWGKLEAADEDYDGAHHGSRRLLRIRDFSRSMNRDRRADKLPSDWLKTWRELWDIAGWPGSRVLSSDEYQQVSQFNKVCDDFCGYDLLVSEVSLSRAAQLFRKHCESHVYHRETVVQDNTANAVQLLGGLEAGGLTFDALWLVGMSERQWPAMPSPNALIPRELQLQFTMPSASLDREFDYAQRLTQNYLASANEVVVSYPDQIDDVECKLSPLFVAAIASMGAECQSAINRQEPVGLPPDRDDPFDYIEDYIGLPLRQTSDAPHSLQGGSSVLADHADNPLLAYFKWRLGIRPLAAPLVGVTPLERGNTVHSALEAIWRRLGDSNALNECSRDDLQLIVAESVNQTFDASLSRRFKALPGVLGALEKQRLQILLASWLEIEKNRPNFDVAFLEYKVDVELSGLSLQLRLDRIDRLSDDSLLLIDYKTGDTHTADWLAERILSPQLPLYNYSMAQHEEQGPATALAFARLKSGDLQFDGVAKKDAVALGISGLVAVDKKRHSVFEDWAELEQHWDLSLTAIADEIKAGYAALDLNQWRRFSNAHYEPLLRMGTSEISGSQASVVEAELPIVT